MKQLITAFCLVLLSISAYAEQALSKALIEQYVKSTDMITPIMKANPELDKQLDEILLLDKSEIINKLKSTDVYTKVKSAVTIAGFDDVEHYLDTSFRIMGAIFNSQMQKLPDGMTFDSYLEQMQQQLSMMKSQGMPKEMIAQMEVSIKEQLKNMEFMKKVAANASKADVEFATQHFEWIMELLPADDESADGFSN